MKKNYIKRIGVIACLSFLLCGSYFASAFNKQVINSAKAIDDEPTSISASTIYKFSVGDNIYKEHNEKAWREYFPKMLLRID